MSVSQGPTTVTNCSLIYPLKEQAFILPLYILRTLPFNIRKKGREFHKGGKKPTLGNPINGGSAMEGGRNNGDGLDASQGEENVFIKLDRGFHIFKGYRPEGHSNIFGGESIGVPRSIEYPDRNFNLLYDSVLRWEIMPYRDCGEVGNYFLGKCH
jgi:hypothetical protein